jgi:hypothetical protein
MRSPKFFMVVFLVNSLVAVALGAYFAANGVKYPALFMGGMVNLALAWFTIYRIKQQARKPV